MTVEINGGEKLSKSEVLVNNFSEYFRDEKLGSVKLTAFFNYWDYNKYVNEWRDNLDYLTEYPESKDRSLKESRIRIDEIKIAALETETARNRTTLPGYDKTYEQTAIMLEEIQEIISDEDIEKHPFIFDDNEKIEEVTELSLGRFLKIINGVYDYLISRENK